MYHYKKLLCNGITT